MCTQSAAHVAAPAPCSWRGPHTVGHASTRLTDCTGCPRGHTCTVQLARAAHRRPRTTRLTDMHGLHMWHWHTRAIGAPARYWVTRLISGHTLVSGHTLDIVAEAAYIGAHERYWGTRALLRHTRAIGGHVRALLGHTRTIGAHA